MIIVEIFGGLASQMDQYIFAEVLRRIYPDTEVKISLYFDHLHQHNDYELDKVFGINEKFASNYEVSKLADFYPDCHTLFGKLMNYGKRIRKKIFGPKESHIIVTDPTVFNEKYFNLDTQKSYLFFGNYAHEMYRGGFENEIRKQFHFIQPLNEKNLAVMKDIECTNSVSIHVRHGDYYKYNFPILSLDYYKKAIAYINSVVSNARFFVFSDDKSYISQEFSFVENKVIIDWNSGEESFNDMRLMSKCKHNIIANSGFSYMGAWLNENRNKVVVAPSKHTPWCKNPNAYSAWHLIDVDFMEKSEK